MSDTYQHFIGYGVYRKPERDEDQFMEALSQIYPPQDLLGQNNASRELLRQSAGKGAFPFEVFRAVPMNRISDSSGLGYMAWLGYGKGVMSLLGPEGENTERVKEALREDPEFRADLDSVIQELSKINVPMRSALIREVISEEVSTPALERLKESLSIIEEDYSLTCKAIDLLRDELNRSETSTAIAVREIRKIKDPSHNVMGLLHLLITQARREDSGKVEALNPVAKLADIHSCVAIGSAG